MNQNDEHVSLADFRGSKNVILYFHPKDDTPGCTVEANQFTALADVQYGVTADGHAAVMLAQVQGMAG